ncbi:MAG TPA: aldo/keto reductase [Ktedonobacterales bacterium]|jgi:aryl-alcohol dehydrogenase-like predicted oxidoreductase
MMQQTSPVAASGSFTLGGDLKVNRLGFGTMRLTGKGIWGPPADKQEALAVLRRAVESGVNFIDTADSYGPGISEELIAEALYPYPAELVIATKGGFQRPGPGQWVPDGRPEHLREAIEGSLKRLRLKRIEVYFLHTPDPKVPLELSVGELERLREAGKIHHIGLSNVSKSQFTRARQIAPIAAIQNQYNLLDRTSEEVVEVCERAGLAFIPWFPLAAGQLAHPGGALDQIARARHAATSQIALAWLLKRSGAMLPIPGTSKVSHLQELVAAAEIQLSESEFQTLAALRP